METKMKARKFLLDSPRNTLENEIIEDNANKIKSLDRLNNAIIEDQISCTISSNSVSNQTTPFKTESQKPSFEKLRLKSKMTSNFRVNKSVLSSDITRKSRNLSTIKSIGARQIKNTVNCCNFWSSQQVNQSETITSKPKTPIKTNIFPPQRLVRSNLKTLA